MTGARLKLDYDRAVGDSWRAEIAVDALERSEIDIGELRLTGSGSLVQGEGSAIGQLRGNATYAALEIAPRDPALAEAIGPPPHGGDCISFGPKTLRLSSLIWWSAAQITG